MTQYTVKAGDTFFKIARENSLSVAKLQQANPQINNTNQIKIGDIINIPSGRASSNVDIEDLDVMARTIYGEARGESDQGKIAVGWVIVNRVAKQTWYGKDVFSVCRKPFQFSCWNDGDPNKQRIKSIQKGDPVFNQCIASAEKVLTGSASDPTGEATHYYATSINAPSWTQGATFTVQIGAHKFYKNVR
jgi:N-acetylmuramoyl-L-alanine amidase